MTATSIVKKLWKEEALDPYIASAPTHGTIIRSLKAWKEFKVVWTKWENRNTEISGFPYARERDSIRAYYRNDLNLAATLDRIDRQKK